jgi:4-hydroxyphenylpyruvate dioxygenase
MNYEAPKTRPSFGKFLGFHHVTFYVGNAKQAASFYTSRLGFEYLAYKGLETGSRETVSHVVSSDRIIFEFKSSYDPEDKNGIGEHVKKHGDGVNSVTFEVENATAVYNFAISKGAKSFLKPTEESTDEGITVISGIEAYNDTVHYFVEKKNYKGVFLPGYEKHPLKEVFNKVFDHPGLLFIDHVVCNHKVGDMEATAQWYEKMLSFHRFWSVDDTIMHTEYSALNSIVMADFDRVIKLPINEPAKGKKKSQIQEYVDYYAGAGVQHIALRSEDIIKTITNLRNRGVEFLMVPKSYYDNLRKNIPKMSIKIIEDIDKLEELGILIDYDDKGYLLQLFTKPIQDRPTLFLEVIQRRNHQGFGAGNFKSLFKAIEDEQDRRGNLTDM